MSILTAIAYATGWLIGQGIRVADWLLQDIGSGRGEVAEHPDRPDEYAAGVRIYLTDAQVDRSIADMERQFPKTKDRRIR